MFTVKHRRTDGSEIIEGPFERIGFRMEAGAPVVRADRGPDTEATYGPLNCRSSDDHEPIVWVMNAQGATVATYRL